MLKTIVRIDGMMCSMCESHICDIIRKLGPGLKVSASRKKGEAVICSEQAIPEDRLIRAVSEMGYRVLGISSTTAKKKKWFWQR